MSTLVAELLARGLGDLRHQPIGKRIRAELGGQTVVDSTRAVLVWEPRRFVPSYAVPAADIRGDLLPDESPAVAVPEVAGSSLPELTAARVLSPRDPFSAHTAPGRVVNLTFAGERRAGAGFLLADGDLDGYVVLDFAAFDAWYQEDELNVAHPRDPFKRIDVLQSSRHVRLELDGEVIAECSRPLILFETFLPDRYYMPRADVRVPLVPSETATLCAYKGRAAYWSATIGGRTLADLAWTYEEPLHDAALVRGLVAFFNERVDVVVDGERRERPITPWSS